MIRATQNMLNIGLFAAIFLTGCATTQTEPTTQTEATATTIQTEATATTQPEPTATPTITAKIKSTWKNFTYYEHPHKIIVVGIATDSAGRKAFEDGFVRELKSRGVDAIASYTLLADNNPRNIWHLVVKIDGQHADAVLVTRLVKKNAAQLFEPGTVFHPSIYYDNWTEFYGYSHEALLKSDAITEGELALLETNLYDAQIRNMIWAGTSETEMTNSDRNTLNATISAMTQAMSPLLVK